MEEKNYASDLIASGIARNNIYEIAFAFDGKEVLVKERHVTASISMGRSVAHHIL